MKQAPISAASIPAPEKKSIYPQPSGINRVRYKTRLKLLTALISFCLIVVIVNDKHDAYAGKVDPDKVPVNSFYFAGNALICKADSLDELACYHIGKYKVGMPYKPRRQSLKVFDYPGGVKVAVFPIIATKQYQAYWAIGHKGGQVVSVQVTGNYPHDALSFSEIKLGDSTDKVKSILGPRFRVREVKAINGVMWNYYPFAISIEFVRGRVYSIRITK